MRWIAGRPVSSSPMITADDAALPLVVLNSVKVEALRALRARQAI